MGRRGRLDPWWACCRCVPPPSWPPPAMQDHVPHPPTPRPSGGRRPKQNMGSKSPPNAIARPGRRRPTCLGRRLGPTMGRQAAVDGEGRSWALIWPSFGGRQGLQALNRPTSIALTIALNLNHPTTAPRTIDPHTPHPIHTKQPEA